MCDNNADIKVLDNEIKNVKELISIKMESLDRATVIAKESMERRLDAMNEFRAQLKDQSSSFITRKEHDIVLEYIQDLRESRAKLEGKADQQSVNRVMWIAIVGIFISIVGLFFQSMRLQQVENKSYGYQDYIKHTEGQK